MKLSYTRAMITAALTGKLNAIAYEQMPFFELSFPTSCDGVPSELLNPRNTWADKAIYDQTAASLAAKFVKNFDKFAAQTDASILAAAPKVPA
jgi:phosphoenolpyruvate carboxykinase (ATP)